MWNKEFLLKKRSQYKKYLKRNCNPEEEIKIINTLDSIDYILDFMCRNDQEILKESFKDNCRIEGDFFSYYKELVPFISKFTKDFRTDIFFTFRALESYNNKEENVLNMTSAFYNSLDKRFSKPFNRVFDKNKQWIRYGENNADCYTFPIYNTNIILMLLSHYSTIEDYLTMVHEYGHALDIIYGKDEIQNASRVPFAEVVSMFMEMIYGDFLRNLRFDSEDLLAYDINTFTKYLELSIIANEKNDIVSKFNDSKIFSAKQATKYLKEEVGMEDFGIEQVLQVPITEQFPYVTSYLIAIELYLIYLQDKDEALNIVYKFMKLKDYSVNDYIQFFRSSGAKIGNNTNQYVKILKNRNDSMRYDK